MNLVLIIKKSRLLRSALLLSFLVLTVLSFLLWQIQSIRDTNLLLYEDVLKNQKNLIEIQQILTMKPNEALAQVLHEFSYFEAVIPFISVIEDAFQSAASEVQVALQEDEVQIKKQHSAQYVVILSGVSNGESLKKTFEEIYARKELIDIRNTVIDYKEGHVSDLQFVMRLHLL